MRKVKSGFKQKQLGEIRRETSYPLLRTYIASIRVTALLVASFIGLLALLGIGGAWTPRDVGHARTRMVLEQTVKAAATSNP